MLSSRQERDIKRIRLKAVEEYIGLTLTQAELGVEINAKYLESDLREIRDELIKLDRR